MEPEISQSILLMDTASEICEELNQGDIFRYSEAS